jgi:hypothetical protein
MNDSVINPAQLGNLVIAIKKVPEVSFIELLNYVGEDRMDPFLEFYIDLIGKEIYDRDLRFPKAERVRRIAPHYARCEIYYSFSEEDKIKTTLKGSYDYVLVTRMENIITAYERATTQIRKLSNKKVSLDFFCRVKDICLWIADYREQDQLVAEWGKLEL